MKKALLATTVLIALAPLSAFGFVGMLSTSDGLIGTGSWAEDLMIQWNVTQQSDLSWYYEYTLTGLSGRDLIKEVSHVTLEISPNVPESRFWGFNFDGDVEFGDFDGISNAMKMDWTATTYSFYSWQAPVWGDFYAKDGVDDDTKELNAIWNAGFALADPMSAPADGSIDYKILRPDTYTAIPEPGTMLLFGLGLVGAGLRKRFLK